MTLLEKILFVEIAFSLKYSNLLTLYRDCVLPQHIIILLVK